ncbi:MAG: hypothetical protein RL563_2650 [Pseudomonadota bacterium]|jgi:hypothetical protein
MSKHTPGPWLVWNYDNDPRHVYVGPQAGGLCVAGVVACNPHGIYTAETEVQGMANARLIAAAPELLNALREMEEFFRGEEHLDPATEEMFSRARAAIVKATGGDNES